MFCEWNANLFLMDIFLVCSTMSQVNWCCNLTVFLLFLSMYLKIFCKVGLLLVMRTRYYYENVMCYFYFALIFVWEILIHVMFLCKKKSVLLPPKKVFYLSLAWYYSFWKYKIQNTWFTYFISRKGMFFNDQRQVRNLPTCV